MSRLSGGNRLAILGLGTAIALLLAVQVSIRVGDSPSRPAAAAEGAGSHVLGVTTLPLARNSWRAWQPSDLSTVDDFERAIDAHVGVVMWYADWEHARPSLAQLDAVAARGSIPEITWEPWDALHAVTEQPKYRLGNIVAGRFDAYIREWAEAIAGYGKPVRLRFAQEMNGRWYPWSELANGNRPGEFVEAWRHVHALFEAAGAANVRWVWSPAAITMSASQYPGDRYVDIVSLTVFNGGSQLRYSPWRSFEAAVRTPLQRLREIAPGKPMEYSEVGCADEGGDRAAWLAAMVEALGRSPAGTTLVWYELKKNGEWRVETSPTAAAAFAAAVEALRRG